jgi:O-antigen ligase
MSRGYEESLSLSFRVDIWEIALKVILNDPINFFFGTGSGTSLYWTQIEVKGHYFTPHNSYLSIWLETGLLGLLSFLLILFILFIRSLKTYLRGGGEKTKSIVFAMLGIVPGLLVLFCFSSTAMEHSSQALILVFVAFGASANKLTFRGKSAHRGGD